MKSKYFLWLFSLLVSPALFAANSGTELLNLHMINSGWGYAAIGLFVLAFILVTVEEFTHLRKSKPVILVASLIWLMIGYVASQKNLSQEVIVAIRHNLLEYGELFLFLLVAMTYVNAMEERNVFACLRSWLVRKGFNFKQLFWITGILTFFISPIADNLTTALIMCAVVIAVASNSPRFVTLACINIVVSANAGGAFSPFGDITTLMVWQKGIIPIQDFLKLFLPAAVNYLIPAIIMHFAIPDEKPEASDEVIKISFGGRRVVIFFIVTVALTVMLHNTLHLPPVIGMMTGLAFLQFLGYYLKKKMMREHIKNGDPDKIEQMGFDVFKKIERVEWDTLLFFYGVILAVGGLATLGYLGYLSDVMFLHWGSGLPEGFNQTPANIAVGFLSAIIDNIPVMFAVLTMHPSMSEGQWLLVTLTAGVGGSMLSIGSAAGVALMGQSRGLYTFFGHLKWTWAIALGYIASIAVHLWLNYGTFALPPGGHIYQ